MKDSYDVILYVEGNMKNYYYDEILFLPMPNFKILALFFYLNSLMDCHILTKDYFDSIKDHLSEEYGNVRLCYDPEFEFWGGKVV